MFLHYSWENMQFPRLGSVADRHLGVIPDSLCDDGHVHATLNHHQPAFASGQDSGHPPLNIYFHASHTAEVRLHLSQRAMPVVTLDGKRPAMADWARQASDTMDR
jgi:hypothetical protein